MLFLTKITLNFTLLLTIKIMFLIVHQSHPLMLMFSAFECSILWFFDFLIIFCSHIPNFIPFFILEFTYGQRDTSGLTAENRELKLRLQSMEEQAKLRDGMSYSFRSSSVFVIKAHK
jgi:hypothetical protein